MYGCVFIYFFLSLVQNKNLPWWACQYSLSLCSLVAVKQRYMSELPGKLKKNTDSMPPPSWPSLGGDSLNLEWAGAHLETSPSPQMCLSLVEKLCSTSPKWSCKIWKPHTTGQSNSLCERWQVWMSLRKFITELRLASCQAGGFKGNESAVLLKEKLPLQSGDLANEHADHAD